MKLKHQKQSKYIWFLTLGLFVLSICSLVGTLWLDDAGLKAWLLPFGVVTVPVFNVGSSSSSSSSSPELLSSTAAILRLFVRLNLARVSWWDCSWATTLSWRRPPLLVISDSGPRNSSLSSCGERCGCSERWFGGPPLLRPSETIRFFLGSLWVYFMYKNNKNVF